jgi:peptidoglycan/xylan/chitin deacetylase (PgdA/CDA1 family)
MLGWSEVRELDGGPLWFESHTLTHPNLIGLSAGDSWREIAESRRRLSAELGRPILCLAYPAGAASKRERRFAHEAGYRYGVTCKPGVNHATDDLLCLRRTAVERHDRLIDFRAKLEGAHDQPLPGQGLYRRLRGLAAD